MSSIWQKKCWQRGFPWDIKNYQPPVGWIYVDTCSISVLIWGPLLRHGDRITTIRATLYHWVKGARATKDSMHPLKCSRNRYPFMPLQNELSPLSKQGVSSTWDSGYSVCLLRDGQQMPLWCASSNLAVDDAAHLHCTLSLTLPWFKRLHNVDHFRSKSDWPRRQESTLAGIISLHFTSGQQPVNLCISSESTQSELQDELATLLLNPLFKDRTSHAVS